MGSLYQPGALIFATETVECFPPHLKPTNHYLPAVYQVAADLCGQYTVCQSGKYGRVEALRTGATVIAGIYFDVQWLRG